MTGSAVRVRLTARITLLIVLVLVVGFGVSTILTIQRESALLVEQNKMAARQLIGTLVSSIETAMPIANAPGEYRAVGDAAEVVLAHEQEVVAVRVRLHQGDGVRRHSPLTFCRTPAGASRSGAPTRAGGR